MITYYISHDGNDNNDGLTWQSRKRTIESVNKAFGEQAKTANLAKRVMIKIQSFLYLRFGIGDPVYRIVVAPGVHKETVMA